MKRDQLLTAAVSGLLFGTGLAISGMTDARKVVNFLDIAGHWDPSLGLVIITALVVTVPAFTWARHRLHSFDGQPLPASPAGGIDRRLITGSALFGIGWGIAGWCPGPALANLGAGSLDALWFVLAMLAGGGLIRLISSPRTSGTLR